MATLLQTEVLNDHEVDEIKSKKTEADQVDQLLHFITRTSHKQYLRFLTALNDADHAHVYIKLRGNFVCLCISERVHMYVCVCVCVCVYAHARVSVCITVFL